MDLTALTDGELARLLGGDQAGEAFTALFERYVRPVHDFVARTVRDLAAAEDLTQRAFIQAWEQRGALRDPDAVKPWVYRIAGNLALNHVTRTRPPVDLDEVASVVEATDATPEARTLTKEAARLVWDAAASLEPRQRTVLELSVRQQLTSPEIAVVLAVSPAQASLLVHRAREALGNGVRYLLVARRRTHCARLAEMVPAGVLQLTTEQRASVDRHMRRCESCQGMASRLTSPEALLGSMVLLPVPASLRRSPHLRLTAATLVGAGTTMESIDGAATAGREQPERRRRHTAVLLLLLLLFGGVAGVVLPRAFAGTSPAGRGTAGVRPSPSATTILEATPSPSPTAASPAPAPVAITASPTTSPRSTPTPRPTPTPVPAFTVSSISLCFVDGTGACAAPGASTCVSSPPGFAAPTYACPFQVTFDLTAGHGGTLAWSVAGTAWSCTTSSPVSTSGTAVVPSPAPAHLTITGTLPLKYTNPNAVPPATASWPISTATATAPAWPAAARRTASFYGGGGC